MAGSRVQISTLFITVAIIVLSAGSATSLSIPADFNGRLEGFSQNIFGEIFALKPFMNNAISPLAIETSLAMIRMGATGATANELDKVLDFTGETPENVADNFNTLLTKYADGNTLIVTNIVVVKKDYQLQDSYKDLMSKKFLATAESVNEAAGKDNVLFYSSTTFKSNWGIPFAAEDTVESDFHVNRSIPVKVQMMKFEGYYDFIRSSEWSLIAARLPLGNPDLSMLVITPHRGESLTQLESRLSQLPLKSLKEKFGKVRGHVFLPKFKVESEIELTDTLKKMGLQKIFNGAEFGKMFKSLESANVSQIVHKAVVEFTEAGTKPTPGTDLNSIRRYEPVVFRANQPFYYAIINEDFVPLLQGTVAEF